MSSIKAPDGSPIALYLAIGTEGEPELIHKLIPRGAAVLDLGCGVGRIAHALVALGHPVTAVDESAEMLARVHGATMVRSRIEDLRLGRTFPCVLLMSNLVNTGRAAGRRRLLRTCRRHVAADGVVIVERYDPTERWAEGVSTGSYGGLAITVERRGTAPRPYVRATYRHPDGREWTHEGRGRPHILGDAALRAELELAGLRLVRVLGPRRRWCVARPIERGTLHRERDRR